MNTIQQFLDDNVRLPSPPAIAIRIIDLVKCEDFSFNRIGAVIQSDPALAGRILRLANSGLYSLPRKVSNIDTAVGVLGVNALKNIALSFVLSEVFQGHRGDRFDFDRLWRRSITAAVAAELVSKAVGFRSDETFIASLLQDIGIGAMFICNKENYLAVLDEKAVTGLPVATVERQIFGFDHQEVGGELLKKWGLPESIYLPIRHHHNPENAPPETQRLCNILRASDRISAVYHGSVKNVRSAKEILLKSFGLNETKAAALIDSVADKTECLLAQFDIAGGKMQPFSQILQEANEELSRLNLSYEMLVMEHMESKQRAERLAVELRAANDKLRHFAFRDGLTGLFNHRYFQETLTREFARAKRYRYPLALIMFDLDEFKAINDAHGHVRGDAVLKAIGEEILRTSRTSDFVARYGGEEFAIILPETNDAGACIKAEAFRAAVEAAEIDADGVKIRTTISVGVASYEPPEDLTKEDLIDFADRGMYRSKIDGRNRATVWRHGAFIEKT